MSKNSKARPHPGIQTGSIEFSLTMPIGGVARTCRVGRRLRAGVSSSASVNPVTLTTPANFVIAVRFSKGVSGLSRHRAERPYGLAGVLNKCAGFQGPCDYATRLSGRSIALLKCVDGGIPIAFRFELG
jgi:hypothetical protein